MRRLVSRLLNVLGVRGRDADLDREIRAHLALLQDAHEAKGMPPDEAKRAARLAFGNVDLVKDLRREAASFRWLDDLGRDMRQAARSLAHNRVFTATSVLTLALGIGVTVAIFSVFDAVLLRPLPYADPDRLVRLIENVPAAEAGDGQPHRNAALAGDDLRDLAARTRTLSVAGYGPSAFSTMGAVGMVRLDGTVTSRSFFELLGVHPLLGRTFDERDEFPDAERLVVLSYAAWRTVFAGDPGIVGRRLTLAGATVGADDTGAPRTVIGVMPPDFQFPDAHSQFWEPVEFTKNWRPPALARLANGATPQAAAAEVATIVLAHRGASADEITDAQRAIPTCFEVVRAQDELVEPFAPTLYVLAGAVVLVLLIACVNVANLLFVRAATRQREIAVRIALGASRGRIVRHLLIESAVLSAMGGTVGLALAWSDIRLLRALAATLPRIDLGGFGGGFPRLDAVGINSVVLVFTLTVCIATTVICGLAPALRYSRIQQRGSQRDVRSTPSAGLSLVRRDRAVGSLVVAEIAMATLLLIAGGLLMRSFLDLATVPLGYDPSPVETFQVELPSGRHEGRAIATFAEAVTTALEARPNVAAAGYATQLPMVALRNSVAFRRQPALLPPGAPGTTRVSSAAIICGPWACACSRAVCSMLVTRLANHRSSSSTVHSRVARFHEAAPLVRRCISTGTRPSRGRSLAWSMTCGRRR
jgi:predicted permease